MRRLLPRMLRSTPLLVLVAVALVRCTSLEGLNGGEVDAGDVDAEASSPDVHAPASDAPAPGDAGSGPRSCAALSSSDRMCHAGGTAADCCEAIALGDDTFDRGDNTGYFAHVGPFLLDRFEVTVARFRAFVAAGGGTMVSPPASGAGAHPKIPGSGWDPAWNGALPRDAAAQRAALTSASCTFPTWTEAPGEHEHHPINCLDWYQAFAFCAWDSGRLPTLAERFYAASGGQEERFYPWSPPGSQADAAIDPTYTDYQCSGDGLKGCLPADILPVGSHSPKGDGRWGHADLGGSVLEWFLDAVGEFQMPCSDCAIVDAGPDARRTDSADTFRNDAYGLHSRLRNDDPPTLRADVTGVRCARDP